MKWGGRRKPSSGSSSSSSKPSFTSPFSWLSKFKQMRINNNSEPKQEKQLKHQNTKQNSPSDNSSQYQYASGSGARFYGEDGDDFWRLSFYVEGNNDHKESTEDVIKPEKYNLDAERHGRREGTRQKKEIGVKEERESLNEAKCAKELECLRRRYERKAHRVLQEHLLKSERAELQEVEFAPRSKYLEKDEIQFESPKTIRTPRMHMLFSSSASSTQNSEKKMSSQRQNLKQGEDVKAKVSKPRKSIHVSREIQGRKPKPTSSKVRVHSPRMSSKVETCKIKALEEKKAKLKMKKEEEIVEEKVELDSFAVVKSSLDPQQDFMDSMIEMITEKQISKPEEMEELLACYLTLNSNEWHDLIIEAFRQVWLYLSQAGLSVKSDKQCCCCHD
ncbi:transcription repressor OFP5-like [Lotus japonicus]|uniref:transcription repressor OFP5-like n=1 Tax=Lotus japonicus TaxID=34305 RepID=UPI00258EF697|nr:transcription repressor OFP5-like [Lotus japonicus]